MNYRSIEDLNRYIVKSLNKVPVGTDLIVGVPRSGLLAANLLALQMNLPFTDVEGFLNGRILQSGERLKSYLKPFEDYKNIIVIEDSVWSGKSIQEVKKQLEGKYPEKNLLYAAVFVVPDATDKVDIYFDICPGPRVFEWNLLHHDLLEKCCVDIDGVLCKDPTEDDNDDGENYLRFLSSAETLFLPSATIGYLVTNRLEKYRPQTEAWLSKHNIRYNKLIMLDLPSKDARLNASNHGGFKASVYTKYDAWLFIESSNWQAQQIADKSGKPVYCMDTRKMVYPNLMGQSKRKLKLVPKKIKSMIKGFFPL